MMQVSVSLSVRQSAMEVHWRIIANLGFKFRSKFTSRACMHCECMRARGKGSSPGRVDGSSRAMPATARPSCCFLEYHYTSSLKHGYCSVFLPRQQMTTESWSSSNFAKLSPRTGRVWSRRRRNSRRLSKSSTRTETVPSTARN